MVYNKKFLTRLLHVREKLYKSDKIVGCNMAWLKYLQLTLNGYSFIFFLCQLTKTKLNQWVNY